MGSALTDDLGLWRDAPPPPRPQDAGDWAHDIGEWAVTTLAGVVAAGIGIAVGGPVGLAVLLLALEWGWSL